MLKYLSIDTETTLISPQNPVPDLVCITHNQGERTGIFHWADTSWREWIIGLLNDKDTHFVFHNAPFDICVLSKAYPKTFKMWWKAYKDGRIHDTQLRQQLIDHATGYPCMSPPSLASLYKRADFGELNKDQSVRCNYESVKDLPLDQWPQEFVDYAKKDAEATLYVFMTQETEADAKWLEAEGFQNLAYFCLYLGSIRGMLFEMARVKEIEARAQDIIAKALPTLYRKDFIKIVPEDVNSLFPGRPIKVKYKRSDAAVRDAIDKAFDKQGLEPPKTPSGQTSMKEYVCNLTGQPALKKFSEYTSWSNVLDNDIKMFYANAETCTIRPRINPLLVTGRISTYGPNLQNKRSDGPIRSAFVPRKGFLLVSADYSMAELHTLAQTCLDFFGMSEMSRVINQGLDIHSFFGAKIEGIEYERFYKARKGKYAKVRHVAKMVDFGLGGGMGPRTLSKHAMQQSISMPVEEAAELRKLWLSTFPEIQLYFDLADKNKDTIMSINRTGRYRYVDRFTAAANTHFQGLAADGMKAAWIELTYASYCDKTSIMYGARPILPIHDEALVEVRAEKAEEQAKFIRRTMESAFNKYTPDVPVKVEYKIMDRWEK